VFSVDWSWVDTVVGAGVGVAAYAIGQAQGRRRRRPRDPYADDPQPLCGCGHHFALHDDHGTCRGVIREIEKTTRRGVTWVNHSCGCAKYTGPEPLPRYLP
jgi:hypothetical protein